MTDAVVWMLLFALGLFVLILVLDGIIIGIPKRIRTSEKISYLKTYRWSETNTIAYQKSTECAGFSLAYVLRSYGIQTDGNEVYARMPGKMKNGAVMPRALLKTIRDYGLYARYVKGDLETLKSDLSQGKKAIVFIRTRLDKNWLHYVPVVGYDEEHVYIAESMHSLENCSEKNYNRKLSNAEFLNYWNTSWFYMPFYKYTYLSIQKTKSEVP